jgi:hypothetical protein
MNPNNVFSISRYNSLAEKSGSEMITAGLSEKGRPIVALKKGNGKLKVLFIARIHGNEPATSEALLNFISKNSFEGIEFYGIYMANPDGAALYEELWNKNPEPSWENSFNDARLNSNKVDLNRDWLNLTQKETQVLQKFIDGLKPDIAVDFHEYYWSDKGYPPKYPSEDKDGFMATMTDAPFFGADNTVKEISENIMNILIDKMSKEFNWVIKPRHFIGSPGNVYTNPDFLGAYLALRGIPKLLVETWGVGCSTLLLDKRISFHTKAMEYIIGWVKQNMNLFPLTREDAVLQYNTGSLEPAKVKEYIRILDLHGVKYHSQDNKLNVYCSSLEIGFIKTIYYLIFEKENR